MKHLKIRRIAAALLIFILAVSCFALAENTQISDDLLADAEKGDAEAQYNLGFMYCNGYGVEQDTAQAFEWLSKAAEQGVAEAQYDLGIMYGGGFGVEQDAKKAITLIREAAAQGSTYAQDFLRENGLD